VDVVEIAIEGGTADRRRRHQRVNRNIPKRARPQKLERRIQYFGTRAL
jgi:hypothetical protein